MERHTTNAGIALLTPNSFGSKAPGPTSWTFSLKTAEASVMLQVSSEDHVRLAARLREAVTSWAAEITGAPEPWKLPLDALPDACKQAYMEISRLLLLGEPGGAEHLVQTYRRGQESARMAAFDQLKAQAAKKKGRR
jgi:hypothetical protein